MQPLATSIRRFEDKYAPTAATTANEIADWFSNLYGEHTAVPLGSIKLNETVTLSSAAFAGVTSTLAKYRFSARATSIVDAQQYCLAIPLTGSCIIHDDEFGKVVCDNYQARMFRRNAGTSVTASAGTDILSLAIPSDLLETRARSSYGKELNEPLRFSPMVSLRTREGATIVYLLNYLLSMMGHANDALKHEILRECLLDHLITTVLSVVPNNYDDQPGIPIDSCTPRSVRRAEEWMRAHAHQPITMEQLAREAGCSERALQNAFKSFCNKTPMTVLRDIRLEGAHADLLQDGSRVSDIAFKWGFSNLGRFAAQYEARFQKKPSQTAKELAA